MITDEHRLKKIAESMEQQGWDALVCRLPENVLFLSGWWPLTGTSWIVFARDGNHQLIIPACEALEAQADGIAGFSTYEWAHLKACDPQGEVLAALGNTAGKLGVKKGRIGIEESFECTAPPLSVATPYVPTVATRQMVQKAIPEAHIEDATAFIGGLRVCKTEVEIEKLRIANEIAGFGLAAFRENIAEGLSEIELAVRVNGAIAVRGSGYKGVKSARGFAQISSGAGTERGWRPCEITTDRKPKKGDIVLLELGVVADGFWADNTRVLVAGGPDAKQQKVYDIVQEAQKAAIACIKPGVKMSSVDKAARDVIRSAGYGEFFVHITGHGIGWRYHEFPPMLHPEADGLLEEGMVTSVEPGVYIPEFGGMRVEDIVAVRQNGADVLSTYSRDLQ